MTLLLVRVAGALVAVLALALLAARLTRRTTRTASDDDLRVRERVGLTRETAAIVLETDGRRLLVGVGPTQITLLADLGPTKTPARASHQAPQQTPPQNVIPVQRRSRPGTSDVRVTRIPMTRKAARQLHQERNGRRIAIPPTQRKSGSVLNPRTWQQGLETLRDRTARRG